MVEENVVKLALIGIGNWSVVIADAVMRSKKAKLVTCFGRTPEKRKSFSEKYGCDQETSIEDVVKRKDVDGLLLTTPNAIHAEHTALAGQYGKHVFVEKPIANTMADARKIIEVCQKAGTVLMVGHHMRRFAGVRKLKELVNAGVIGKPIQVEGNFSHDGGFALTPQRYRWKGDDSGCPGGPLMTLGIHLADSFNYLFGPIKTAYSYFNRLYIPAPQEDVTAIIFRFESGILGYLGSNYASPKAQYVYIYGTEANLLCTVTPPELPVAEYMKSVPLVDKATCLQVFEKGKTGAKEIPLHVGDPVLEEIDEFADCIRTGKKPETDGRGALVALSLIRAAIESARTGNEAKLEI